LIPIAGGIQYSFLGVGIFGWLPMLAGVAMAWLSNSSRKFTVVGKI
jgi:hypothetical protein